MRDHVVNSCQDKDLRWEAVFVASCYEVAALRLNERTNKEPIYPFGKRIDPRAMTAKAVEAVLHRS